MKHICMLSIALLIFLVNLSYAEAGLIQEKGSPNILISSPEKVTAKRNTELPWSWTSIKNVSNVDIYLLTKNKKYRMAKNYPNTGNFWWAAGAAYSEWKTEIKNGVYTVAVCPTGSRLNLSCGYFDVTLYGDTPVIKILKPKAGSVWYRNDEMEVSFRGAKEGEEYEIALLQQVIMTPFTLLGSVTAEDSGTAKFYFEVPEDLQVGLYTVQIVQKTNQGPCVNACAITESKPIRIR